MSEVLEELKVWRAKSGSIVSVPVEVLDRAIAEIEHLRSLAGAVSQGESFSDIKAAAKGTATQ